MKKIKKNILAILRLSLVLSLFLSSILSLLLLTGCGWFRDRSKDYVYAECIPTIQICPGTYAQPFGHEYDIP